MLISVCLAIIFSVVALDQITKIVFWGVTKPLIGDQIWLTPTLNDGAAFSILRGGRIYFVIFTVIVIFVLTYVLINRKISTKPFFRITLSLLLGGIIGNFIDRFLLGAVRDFIYIKKFGFVCNVADIAIVVATFMLGIYIIFLHDYSKQKPRVKPVSESGEKAK